MSEYKTKISEYHPNTYNESKLDIKRKRKLEANKVSSMLKIADNTSWNEDDNSFYLIPMKWFSSWKKYIRYDNHSSVQNSEEEEPGSIRYSELLADDKDYLHNYSVPENSRDKIIKQFAEEGKDYLIISTELHSLLQESYGGSGIKRWQVPIGSNGLRKLFPKLMHVQYFVIIRSILPLFITENLHASSLNHYIFQAISPFEC